MQPLPDEQKLIAQAQRGDEDAVTRLYEAHVEAIFQYVSYRVDSKTTSEDITSEVFLRMVRGLANYKSQGIPFRVWLFRIAANLIVDFYRERQKNQSSSLSENYESDDTDPFDRIVRDEEQLRMRLALRSLPETYQDLLIFRFVEDLPHAEISKIMNKSAVALRAMQHRALKALVEQLNRLSANQPSMREDER